MTTQTATEAPRYVETSTSNYPYRTLHTAECKTAARAKYKTEMSLDEAAGKQAGIYSRTQFHSVCLAAHNDAWTALIKRTGEVNRARQKAEHRQRLIVDLAVARVAALNLQVELGSLSTQEQARLDEYVQTIPTGDYRPRSSDLRDVAMPNRSRY